MNVTTQQLYTTSVQIMIHCIVSFCIFVCVLLNARMKCGSLEFYDKQYDRVTTKNEKRLQRISRIFHKVTTTDDPVIRQVSSRVSIFSCKNVFSLDVVHTSRWSILNNILFVIYFSAGKGHILVCTVISNMKLCR